jgi:lipopolysaccharide/colanic/teichoic acid biosynthesis glycosyltransferase
MSLVSELSQSTTERSSPGPQIWKVGLDFVLACVLMLFATPVMLVAALLVRLTSPGPVLYRQTRLGLHGRRYTIYKIRSMYHDCERLTGPRWSTPGDSRVTWIGKILRATHIDELPQLWNILRGEMSLVGPRPERPEIVVGLELAIPCYRDRLQVRPGVTGLAQVQLAPDTDLESVRRKVAYDLYYIERSSLWLDIRLIIATVLGIVVIIPPSLISTLLAIPDSDTVERAYRDRYDEMDTIPHPVEPRPQANLA